MRWTVRLTLVWTLGFLLSGCIVKDSPAPGCVEWIGISSEGGCFGKTAMIELSLEAVPACVVVEANNCNGGVLEIRNNCEQAIEVEGIQVLPSELVILDIVSAGGSIEVIQTDNNFSHFIPQSDQHITLKGSLGDQPFRIGFIKTRPLCE